MFQKLTLVPYHRKNKKSKWVKESTYVYVGTESAINQRIKDNTKEISYRYKFNHSIEDYEPFDNEIKELTKKRIKLIAFGLL